MQLIEYVLLNRSVTGIDLETALPFQNYLEYNETAIIVNVTEIQKYVGVHIFNHYTLVIHSLNLKNNCSINDHAEQKSRGSFYFHQTPECYEILKTNTFTVELNLLAYDNEEKVQVYKSFHCSQSTHHATFEFDATEQKLRLNFTSDVIPKSSSNEIYVRIFSGYIKYKLQTKKPLKSLPGSLVIDLNDVTVINPYTNKTKQWSQVHEQVQLMFITSLIYAPILEIVNKGEVMGCQIVSVAPAEIFISHCNCKLYITILLALISTLVLFLKFKKCRKFMVYIFVLLLTSSFTAFLTKYYIDINTILPHQTPNLAIGPLFIPFKNQTQVFWFTETESESFLITKNNKKICSAENKNFLPDCERKTKFHSAMIDKEYFVQILGVQYQVPAFNPYEINVISDIHTMNDHTWKMDNNLTLIIGDIANTGFPTQFAYTLKPFTGKNVLLALGNHDDMLGSTFLQQVLNRDSNFVQEIGETVVITLDFMTKPWNVTKDFLIDALQKNKQTKRIFIQSHLQGYSNGLFKSYQPIAKLYEAIIDSGQFPNIKAIMSGHIHQFEAYLYKGVYQFVVGTIGSIHTKPGDILERHGPLNDSTYGGQYHLDTYRQYGQFHISIDDKNKQIHYTFRSLDDGKEGLLLAKYDQRSE